MSSFGIFDRDREHGPTVLYTSNNRTGYLGVPESFSNYETFVIDSSYIYFGQYVLDTDGYIDGYVSRAPIDGSGPIEQLYYFGNNAAGITFVPLIDTLFIQGSDLYFTTTYLIPPGSYSYYSYVADLFSIPISGGSAVLYNQFGAQSPKIIAMDPSNIYATDNAVTNQHIIYDYTISTPAAYPIGIYFESDGIINNNLSFGAAQSVIDGYQLYFYHKVFDGTTTISSLTLPSGSPVTDYVTGSTTISGNLFDDGYNIYFCSGGLKYFPKGGGGVTTLDSNTGASNVFGTDGTYIFYISNGIIYKIPASGGSRIGLVNTFVNLSNGYSGTEIAASAITMDSTYIYWMSNSNILRYNYVVVPAP